MTSYPPSILLITPLTDEALLDEFVEKCIVDRVDLVAVWGPDCERIHDIIDEIVVGDGSDGSRFINTTGHNDQSYEDALFFVQHWRDGQGRYEVVRL